MLDQPSGINNDSPEQNTPIVQKSDNGSTTALRTVFDYVEIFAICITVVFLIFTFALRVCTVNGNSMNNTLKNGEVLLVSNLFYEPKQGDIVVFHQTGSLNEPVVKRIIALGGQTVKIDFTTGSVYVDGVPLDEEYAYLDTGRYDKKYYAQYDMDHYTGIFETVVPEGEIFVMGDNRNHSLDSRSNAIGTVDARRILGRVVFRLSPFGTVD